MSYDISFRAKVQDKDLYLTVGECNANITWNLRDMIVAATGLEWHNEASNGLVKNIIPNISKGYTELSNHPEKYKKYEAPNGWGTIHGCKKFFLQILNDWEVFCNDEFTKKFVDDVYFWID